MLVVKDDPFLRQKMSLRDAASRALQFAVVKL